ncbi:hypothetical protein VZT92_008063 [Zoarces viviparus]|uniref:Uncharacterized protein n=1 Tax=Zoarces viviparus TaxID=48416 RepID=A0AAW1FM39_ZOAVI
MIESPPPPPPPPFPALWLRAGRSEGEPASGSVQGSGTLGPGQERTEPGPPPAQSCANEGDGRLGGPGVMQTMV